ncbi:MAG: hypothetical protein AAF975_06605, partial [Spirochaetota bacterium]
TIVYSFISIFTGIYLDIENIVVRFQMLWKDMIFLIFPLLSGVGLSYYLLFNRHGSALYFIDFQGLSDFNAMITLRYYLLALIVLFLLKTAAKGMALWQGQTALVHYSAWLGLAAMILLSFYTALFPHFIFIVCLWLFALVVEFSLLLFKRQKLA